MQENKSAADWVSIDEVAKTLSVSRDLVRAMIRSGDLDARKFGRIIRVRASSIEEAGRPLSVVGTR